MNRFILIVSTYCSVIFCGSQNLNAENCEITHTIESETAATSPSNRKRIKLGIGEEVTLKLSGGHKATWTIAEGGGKLSSPASGTTSVTFTAPDDASPTCKISAKCEETNGKPTDITFEVVKPNGIRFEYIQDFLKKSEPLSYLYTARVYILPADVSFNAVEVKEFACNSNATGYFVGADGHEEWPNWFPLGSPEAEGKGSLMSGSDLIGYATENELSVGKLIWDIPWKYKINSTVGDLVTVREEFSLSKTNDSSKWTLSVSKNSPDISKSYTQE